MEEHNRDLSPPPALKAMYAPIAPLIGHPLIDAAFAGYERQAVKAKQRYHLLGRLGMALILVSTFYSVAEALILSEIALEQIVGMLAIIAGLAGLGIQAFLYATRAKQRWLIARFGAERVRSINFQAYSLVPAASDTAELAASVHTYYSEALAQLDAELNSGEAALKIYNHDAALALAAGAAGNANDSLAQVAARAFIELRLNYQKRFATSEVLKLDELSHVGESFADFLYLAGGCLAVAALTVKLALPEAQILSGWIDFAAIAAFILGLAKIVFDAASNTAPSRERYELYVKELQTICDDQGQPGMTLVTLIARTERAALTELGQFCASALRISYRL